jgi:Helicase HerA, central domain
MNRLRVAAVQLDYAPNMTTAVGNYWLPDEPADVMPPLEPFPDSLSIRRLAEWGLPQAAQQRLLNQNQKLMRDQFDLRLRQVLDYCAGQSCDLVVFPEAAIPASSSATLCGYASSFCIFAGIGRIRRADLQLLSSLGIEEKHVHCNCAVFLDRDTHRVVSKLRLADAEEAEPGAGVETFSISRAQRTFGVAAAICKDYLADENRINDAPFPVDIVLIGSLSRNTEEFTGSKPRYLRVFANHAAYGGTCIQVQHLRSLSADMLDKKKFGTAPIPPDTEGVVIVDYYGLPSQRTSYQARYNDFAARPAIIYDDGVAQGPDRTSASGIVKRLQSLSVDELDDPATIDFLDNAARDLTQGGYASLADAVRVIRTIQFGRETMTQEQLASLTRHILLTDVQSYPEVRYSQLENLLEVVVDALMDRDQPRPGLGGFRDDLLGTKQALIPRVRLRYRSSNDRNTGVSSSRREDTAGEVHFFYAAVLGRYRADAAVRSLPLQLDVLRTLAAQGDSLISLTYRLVTTRQLTTDLVPFLECTGEIADAAPGKVESLREGLGQLMGVAHASGYDVGGHIPPLENLEWEMEIRPRSNDWAPPISDDWAPLIDLLRSQANAIELTMTCAVDGTGPGRDYGGCDDGLASFPVADLRVAERFVTEPDQKAARFLASLGSAWADRTEPRNLRLSFVLRSAAAPPETLITSIALRLIGSENFQIVDLRAAPSPVRLTPSQAIRIFHPPYGVMQGRGMAEDRTTILPLPAIQLPSGGISLGTATLSSPRNDRRGEVRLDIEARMRHLYVIGRTGTGKTNFLKTLARQDIRAGAGLAVIDPHGDLVDYLLRHVDSRAEEVVLLDFSDPDAVPVLNPIDLDVDEARTGSQRLAIDDFIRLLEHTSYHEFYGPRFEDVVRLTLESLVSSSLTDTATVLDVTRVLRSKEQRSRLTESLSNPDLLDRWRNFEGMLETELANLVHWVVAKFTDMDQDGVLGPVFGGGRSSVSLNKVVEKGGILLVRIPEWEIGPAASSFIGALIQERLRRAAFARFSASSEGIVPFYLYVDEFQRFATSGFEQLVAEARKFGLGLILAHQNIRQLEAFSRFRGSPSRELIEAVVGNVANMVVLGISAYDAGQLSPEFGVPPELLGTVPANAGVAKVDLSRGDSRTFTLRIPYAESDPGVLATKEIVRRRMVESGMWRARENVERFMKENKLAVEGPSVPGPRESTGTLGVNTAERYMDGAEASNTGPEGFLDGWRKVRAALV